MGEVHGKGRDSWKGVGTTRSVRGATYKSALLGSCIMQLLRLVEHYQVCRYNKLLLMHIDNY